MDQQEILLIFHETILLIVTLSAPLLIISIAIGLVVSVFQAATQIHEQTLTFVPKVLAIAIVLIIIGSWLLTSLVDFFKYTIDIMIGL